MKLQLLVLAAVVAVAAASCPNSCSGHGNCGQYDKCSCWPNWQGADCSLRTCNFAEAWAVDHAHDAHYYAECSNQGLCDRSTGLCECFDCFSGRACQRLSCPNDCSGHGKCRLIRDLNAVSDNDVNAYTGWDANMIQTCVCDGGYQGADCSERKCPTGDDILTSCSPYPSDQIQELRIRFDTETGTITNDEIALVFTDNLGNTWKTRKVAAIATDASADFVTALQDLPNFAVPSVSVARVPNIGSNTTTINYKFTFSDDRNSGNQTLLSCEANLGCQVPGCQPMYKQIHRTTATVEGGANAGDVLVHADTVLDDSIYVVDQSTSVHDALIKVFVSSNITSDVVAGPSANQWAVSIQIPSNSGSVNYVPMGSIPLDYGKVEIASGMFIAFSGRDATPGIYNFEYSVPECTVITHRPAAVHAENAECGNRGVCDRSTGSCQCFEGYYGDACGTQSILV